ncbi:DUF4836 family protein [Parafilimonas sp.]|uniref:DUF4836 family protein n=1 Tax=Parafilimonas sp. TaxID=1969739 RepID=UPI0039E62EE8
MKNKSVAVIGVCFAMIIFNACKQTPSSLALYVPKDASAVFVIDAKSMADKIASSDITLDSLASLMHSGNDNMLKWNDIENSGVDISKPLYVFTKEAASIQRGNIESSALIAEVNDENKMEAFFKARKPGSAISSISGYKYLKLQAGVIAGWTNKVLIVSCIQGDDVQDAVLQSQLTALFNQKESESIASTGAFKQPFTKPSDIHFYISTAGKLNEAAVVGMPKIAELLQNSYTDGVVNFEKGKIEASGATHYNETFAGIVNKYPAQEIKPEMIKNYPDTLTGLGIVSFNPKLLTDILHYLGFDAMADGFTSDIGFTTADIVNAFSGDIAIMFSSHAQKNMENSLKNGNFLIAAVIGDKGAFDKVMNGLLDKGLLTKKDDGYRLGLSGGHGFVIETGNNNLFIASSDELIKAYQAPGKKPPLPADIEKEAGNKSMALYCDINQFLHNKPIKDTASLNTHTGNNYHNYKIAESASATFASFIAFAGKGDKKTITSGYRLNFVNENENSLASLARFIVVARREAMQYKKGAAAYPPLSGRNSTDSLHAADSVNVR